MSDNIDYNEIDAQDALIDADDSVEVSPIFDICVEDAGWYDRCDW